MSSETTITDKERKALDKVTQLLTEWKVRSVTRVDPRTSLEKLMFSLTVDDLIQLTGAVRRLSGEVPR